MDDEEAFDETKYINLQVEKINQRVNNFNNKLFIEFGGKIFDDFHAARVLPGFKPDTKIKILNKLKNNMEIIFCVSAEDIENKRIRGDSGLTYDLETLRLMEELRKNGFTINNLVITLFNWQKNAYKFAKFMDEIHNENVIIFPYMEKYNSNDPNIILSDEVLGINEYIPTSKNIVLITSPGARSGKLCVALSQIYNGKKLGVDAGYAKYETFPVFDLSPNHLVNLAFMAATADFNDQIMIDYYYKRLNGKIVTSYNRDMDKFPIINKLTHYSSPTDMGFNSVGQCITKENIVNENAKNEIVRRYFRYLSEYEKGKGSLEVVKRVKKIIDFAGIQIDDKYKKELDYSMPETNKSAKIIKEKYGNILEDYYK